MEQNNIRECEVVQDLLPLYHDEACSESSRKYVEKHISECAECQTILKRLQDHAVEDFVTIETRKVLEHHEKKEKTAAYKAGLLISAILLLPVIIMLIVVMAGGSSFGIFFVLLASLLLAAALTVVPLMASENKFAKLVICGMIALMLILFFVDRMNGGGEFLFWAVPTIFGLSVVFFPFVIRAIRLPVALADKKTLLTIFWDTIWLYLTIFETCMHNGNYEGLRTGMVVATILVPWVWLVLIIGRYFPVNGWIKSGLILAVSGIWLAFSQDVSMFFLEHKHQLSIMSADFADWHGKLDANINFICLLVGLIWGGICLLIGMLQGQQKRKKENKNEANSK